MAQATAYNMNSGRGAREDLSDQLKRVEPQETPLFSLLPQSSAPNALLTEWNLDDLGAPNIDPVLDGTDLVFSTGGTTSTGAPGQTGDGDFEFKFNNKVRAGNRVQQLRSGFSVSPMTERIAIAGLASPYAEAKAKATLELKRSIEVMIGSNEKGSASSATLGDISAGLGAWTATGTTGTMWASGALNESAQAYRPVAGSRIVMGSDTLTENVATSGNQSFRAMLQAVYEASGIKASYRLFAGPDIINAISDFTRTNSGATRFNQETTGGGSISLSVVEYKSDYGTVQVIPDLFLQRTRSAPGTLVSKSAFLIPGDDTVSLKVMDGVTAVDLPDIGGGGKRGYVTFTGTTCVLNAKALGSITP
tara:strand:+ start:2124 stop:3212 length:1089 start_codon:yes stop_codon:yes gene_type:complete